mgnify:CR=1 FL=1
MAYRTQNETQELIMEALQSFEEFADRMKKAQAYFLKHGAETQGLADFFGAAGHALVMSGVVLDALGAVEERLRLLEQ